VPPDAVERRRSAVLAGPQREATSPGIHRFDRADVLTELVARIDTLESKIDALVAMMLRDQQREAMDLSIPLEIHGHGLRFRWAEPLDPGQVVQLDITLRLYPPSEVCCLAEVETCEPGQDQPPYLVEARFVAISAASQDEIHRFILSSQRQQRRSDLSR